MQFIVLLLLLERVMDPENAEMCLQFIVTWLICKLERSATALIVS